MTKILLLTSLIGLFLETAYGQQSNLRGLRIDPSYFYNLYPGQSAVEVSNTVVNLAKTNGVNTLFIYAYNTVYGAYYNTTYNFTVVENGYGKMNIFKELTTAAKKNGLKVVAVVPVNNFKHVWDNKPTWRSKLKTGADYIPATDMHLMSAWHPNFRTWLAGFYTDLLSNNPEIDGLEAVEPFVDYHWAKQSDYNSVSNNKFKNLYPKARLGDSTWLKFRAQGLTDLIDLMNTTAHSYNKQSYLVQTWTARSDGSLFSSDVLRDNMGLDINGILNLTNSNKLDFFMAELMWQQWAAEYGGTIFNPNWTQKASLDFINSVNNRSTPLVHVEITPFLGTMGYVAPTLTEFSATLQSIRDLNLGIDVYDYNQLINLNAWDSLLSWN